MKAIMDRSHSIDVLLNDSCMFMYKCFDVE